MITADIEIYKQGETTPSGESGLFLDVIPITLQFRANVISGTPTSYYWDFGDGTTSAIREPDHTYTTYGSHRVVLTTTDYSGTYVSSFFEIKLGKLDFSATPVSGQPPLSVSFFDHSVAPAGCHYTGAMWNYGDGTTGMIGNTLHNYVTTGKYSVSINAILSNV
jgi:PKD repeat protein